MTHPGEEELPVGREVGSFTILSVLGEGGFGTVYLADQREPVRRKVALKILKRGMDTDQVVRRFAAERQALAVMDHPCIAKVYDAGTTPEGLPFFAMEYVEGRPITQYADEQRLDTKARLLLLRDVCRGVHHAHQKGVVHRDLKPTNVLVGTVDGRATPKIIDFGIAKALAGPIGDQTVVTELRQVMGTPEYMAPEQSEGLSDVDTRADVYSVGVLLYELLTGAKPFDMGTVIAQGYQEVMRHIREVTPQKPSTRLSTGADGGTEIAELRRDTPRGLRRRFQGDLDWIVLRSLEKDRERRYQSASELADEIDRYLAQEPVMAGPPSATYRLRKFAARHRVLFTAGLSLAASLLVSVGVLLWSLDRVRDERDEASAARAAEAEARTEVQRALDQTELAREAEALARAEAEDALVEAQASLAESEAVTDFLTDTLASADPGLDGPDLPVRVLLDRSAEEIEGRFAGQPRVETQLRRAIGSAYYELGLLDASARQLEPALELGLATLDPESRRVSGLVSAMMRLREAQDRLEEADVLAEDVVRRARGVGGVELGLSLSGQAFIHQRQGRWDLALEELLEALELLREVEGPDAEATLHCETNLSALYWDRGEYERAAELTQHVADVRIARLGPDHPDSLRARQNRANQLDHSGHPEESAREYLAVLEGRRRVLGENHRTTLEAMEAAANQLRSLGRYPEAELLASEGVERAEQTLGPNHSVTAGLNKCLSLSLWLGGRPVEALAPAEAAVAGLAACLGPDNPETLEARNVLAIIHYVLGEADEARIGWETLLADQTALFGADDTSATTTLGNLGMAYVELGRFAEAEQSYRTAIEQMTRNGGSEHAAVLDQRNNLAVLQYQTDRLEEALETHRDVQAIRARLYGPTNPKTMSSRFNAVVALQELGRLSEARAEWLGVVEIYLELLGAEHPDLGDVYRNLALIEQLQGELDEAERHARLALEIMEKAYGSQHKDTLSARQTLGSILFDSGQLEEAEEVLREALEDSRTALGPGAMPALNSLKTLANLVLELDGKAVAAPLFAELFEGFEGQLESPDVAPKVLDGFAGLLLRTDLPVEADPERALTLAQRATEASGRHEYLVTLARAWSAVGNDAEAQAAAALALERMPAELREGLSAAELLERDD